MTTLKPGYTARDASGRFTKMSWWQRIAAKILARLVAQ